MPALRTWMLAQVGGNGLRGRGPRHRFRRGRRHAALRRQPVLPRNGQGAFRRNGQGGRRHHQIICGRCGVPGRREGLPLEQQAAAQLLPGACCFKRLLLHSGLPVQGWNNLCNLFLGEECCCCGWTVAASSGCSDCPPFVGSRVLC